MLFLLFQIGNDRYALEARHAVEVLPFLELKELPHALSAPSAPSQRPRGVVGVFNYRGQPVAAVDLCELTMGRPSRELLSTRIIIIRVPSSELPIPGSASGSPETWNSELETRNSKLLGLIAEHATGMMRREARDFMNSGPKPDDAPYLGPVAMDDQGVIQLLQTEHLLTETVRNMICSETEGGAHAPLRQFG